jgi:hypothetical protein
MNTQISAHSDVSIRKWQGSHFFKFLDYALKVHFFNIGRIFRFSPTSLDGLKSEIYYSLNVTFYAKEIKF